MSGLHTLVDGLAFSPTSPDPSSPVPPQSHPHLSNSTGTFGASHGSIFNNPNASNASASPRIQSFGARRISYGGSTSTNTSSHRPSGSEGGVTKEVDDPSPHGSDKDRADKDRNKCRNKHMMPTKMFLSPTSPSDRPSRAGSYRGSDTLKLDEFIYKRGFLEGACSDVTIIAFGTRYNLHRLILDRSPFFSSCFNGGPWRESSSSEISITPEQSDPNITQHAFQLALARLYGHTDFIEEEDHALPLLAAASYLDLQDLAESCVASLLRNLKTNNIAKVLKFVTGSYYGHQTDRLLDSAKAMLYRDGWEMDMTEWYGISGELVAEIVGFDGFYIPDEWLRYCFVKEIIDWRICHAHGAEKEKLSLKDGGYISVDENASEDGLLYEDHEADIRPLRDLLENGIYYMHMSFEELQKIRDDKDVLGRSVVPAEVIREALWNQMLLRQKVLNAPLHSPELGLTEKYSVYDPEAEPKKARGQGKTPLHDTPPTSEKSSSPVLVPLVSSGSPVPSFLEESFGPGRKSPKKYLIPTEDSTIVIGDHMALPDQSPGSLPLINQPRGARSLLHGQELTIAAMSGNGNNSLMMDLAQREELRYSHFPPFRFSAEFRGVRGLREKKRVYSKTVFYAGSHWNIYIQKVRSSKNVQLGVYLHRAKDRESALNIAATGYAHGLPAMQGESMLMGHVDIDGNSSTSRTASRPPGGMEFDGDSDATLIGHENMMAGNTHSATGSVRNSTGIGGEGAPDPTQPQQSSQVPAISYYTDARPQVQTYFKIFSPSKKGKVLSMFSSGPDSFNFSQSWGWKSSSLILDESLIAEGDKDAKLRFMVVLGNV